MGRIKIKKFVPNVSDLIMEAVTFKKDYSNATYVNDAKQAETLRLGIENKLNKVRDDYQKGKTTFEQVKAIVTQYIDAKAQVEYLSIMNGIFSQSSTDDGSQSQEESQGNNADNKQANNNATQSTNPAQNQAQKPNQ